MCPGVCPTPWIQSPPPLPRDADLPETSEACWEATPVSIDSCWEATPVSIDSCWEANPCHVSSDTCWEANPMWSDKHYLPPTSLEGGKNYLYLRDKPKKNWKFVQDRSPNYWYFQSQLWNNERKVKGTDLRTFNSRKANLGTIKGTFICCISEKFSIVIFMMSI